jgi:hypothetical protein
MAEGGGITVLFLTRTRFYFYDGSKILVQEFPPTLVRDLDVKDKEAFSKLVSGFIQQNSLVSAQMYVVLSDETCFSKDFPVKDPLNVPKVEADAQAFIDAVPFNSVLSKIYTTPTVIRAVGTNQELVDTIFDAFKLKGFGLSALVPANIYPGFGGKPELTVDLARQVLGNKQQTIESSMIGGALEDHQDHQMVTSKEVKPKSKLLPILLVSFGVLVVILVVVLIFRK